MKGFMLKLRKFCSNQNQEGGEAAQLYRKKIKGEIKG
jgi:hypothetical protein